MKRLKFNLDQLSNECEVLNQPDLDAIKGGDWILDFFNNNPQGYYTTADWSTPTIAAGGSSFDINAFSNLVFHMDDSANNVPDPNAFMLRYSQLDQNGTGLYAPDSGGYGGSGGYGDYGEYSGTGSCIVDDEMIVYGTKDSDTADGMNYLKTVNVYIHHVNTGANTSFNIPKALTYLNNHAYDDPMYDENHNPVVDGYGQTLTSHCARAIRLALEAGGINTSGHPIPARDYGTSLTRWGFTTVTNSTTEHRKGDIRVWQPTPGGNSNGHIDMWNGNEWESDFKENNEFPGLGYGQYPNYQTYRWAGGNGED